jgi:DNA-directed RNA polymerase subunit RPC12/RpoP
MAGMTFPSWDQTGVPEIVPEFIRRLNNPNKIKFLLDYLIFKNSCFKISIKYICGVCSHIYSAKKMTDDYPECVGCGSKYIRSTYSLNYSNAGGPGPFFLQQEANVLHGDGDIAVPPPGGMVINAQAPLNHNGFQGMFGDPVPNNPPAIHFHQDNAPAEMAEDDGGGDEEAPVKHKNQGDRVGFLCRIMTEFYKARFPEYNIPASEIFSIKWVGSGFLAEFIGGEPVVCTSPESTIGKAALLVPAIWDLNYDLASRKKCNVNLLTHDYTPIFATLFNLPTNF